MVKSVCENTRDMLFLVFNQANTHTPLPKMVNTNPNNLNFAKFHFCKWVLCEERKKKDGTGLANLSLSLSHKKKHQEKHEKLQPRKKKKKICKKRAHLNFCEKIFFTLSLLTARPLFNANVPVALSAPFWAPLALASSDISFIFFQGACGVWVGYFDIFGKCTQVG